MFFGLHPAYKTADFTLQQATKYGSDYCALAFGAYVGWIVVWIGKKFQQFDMQPVQQVPHELMGILLLVASER